jgi:formylglycine-generating enzyme required for sulfatase activity
MVAAILCLLLSAQEDKIDALESEVQVLLSKDRYEAAKEAIRKFGADHPRVARLKTRTEEVAREAEARFEQLMAEGAAQLDRNQSSEALQSARKALSIFPERKIRVEEFLERVRRKMPAGDMVRVPGRPCLIDVYPVTNQEYATYVVATGGTPPAIPKGKERHPVVTVTWAEAERYAQWAGKRLPTADEWEAAAQGTDRREYPWGNRFQEKEDAFNCNSVEYWQFHKSRAPGTTPVEEFPSRSAAGASMGGNVWEWTSTAVPGKVGNRDVGFRVLKGGSFMTSGRAVRCTSSLPENPALAHPDVGFRCAKDLR